MTSAGAPGSYPDIKPPTPVAPRPKTPEPTPAPAPSYPRYPSYPTPTSNGDEDYNKRRSPQLPYPSPEQPGNGIPAYPTYPTQPGYPTYPTLPNDGGGDFRYPTLPDEPQIIRRKVVPPKPGPSIDISIGEVIGTVSTIISILSMCWNTYQRVTATSQTYPYNPRL